MILVTGGSGFVGRNLLAHFQKQNRTEEVVGLCRRRPRSVHIGCSWIEADLLEKDALHESLEGRRWSHVVHCAAALQGTREDPSMAVNAEGTTNLLSALRGAPLKRFILVSSADVQFSEISLYGQSKLEAEAAVRASGLPYTIIRPTIVYGGDGTGPLEAFFAIAKRRSWLPIFQDGQLQPVDIEDLAQLISLVISDDAAEGQVIPAGGGRAYSFEDLLRLGLGRASERRFVAAPRVMLRLLESAGRYLPPRLRSLQQKILLLNKKKTVDVALFSKILQRAPHAFETTFRRAPDGL